MEPVTAASSAPAVITMPGYDVLTPLLKMLFGSTGIISGVSVESIFSIFSVIWLVFVVCAYAISFLFLYLYVYAAVHAGKLAELQESRIRAHEEAFLIKHGVHPKQDRLAELHTHIGSHNPNDWKLAIIEADVLLDETLKKQGFAGVSLGERLRSISPSSLSTLDDAWQAHKVRNQIAHEGPDFVLTQKVAQETIVRYERVFKELGVA